MRFMVLLGLLSAVGCATPLPQPIPPDPPARIAPGQVTEMTVVANQGWRSGGGVLDKGDLVHVAATGRWRTGGFDPWVGPDGIGANDLFMFNIVKGYTSAALIGRVGESEPFYVGAEKTFKSPAQGILAFRINDDSVSDTQGEVRVTVQIAAPANGLPASSDRRDRTVSCDLRIIAVSDGSGVANASGEAVANKLDVLAKGLGGKLKEGMVVKGESVAVVSLCNRTGTSQGKVVADELADKVQGALIDTGWFDVKERIDLRAILDEKDLDTAGIVKNENVKKKLAGVKYIVIGGVTVTGPQKP